MASVLTPLRRREYVDPKTSGHASRRVPSASNALVARAINVEAQPLPPRRWRFRSPEDGASVCPDGQVHRRRLRPVP